MLAVLLVREDRGVTEVVGTEVVFTVELLLVELVVVGTEVLVLLGNEVVFDV